MLSRAIAVLFFLLLGITNAFSQEIKVGKVSNEIRIGPLTDNVNLSIGVRNITEELLMDLGYYLYDKAKTQIHIRLVFFDVKNTNRSIGVFHNKTSATHIIAIGELHKNGKIKKKVTKRGVSKEISNSTLVVASDGSFNQQTASNALKKVLIKIIKDLL